MLRITVLLCVVMLFGCGQIYSAEQYEMLARSLLLAGNNLRLKRVIERAQAGEDITIATIGGSITEGAGTSKYADCYASRFAKGFSQRYGSGNGSNVHFVNAGVQLTIVASFTAFAGNHFGASLHFFNVKRL